MIEIDNIYLGDCLELMKEMKKDSVDCIVTDLPYNGVNRETNGLRSLDKGFADSAKFDLLQTLELMWNVCVGSFYLFCGFGQISDIHNFFRKKGCSTRLIVWEKTNPSPMNGNATWLSGIEVCLFAKKNGATFNNHCANTVIRMPIAKPTGHPTPKPIELMGRLILASTNVNDCVLDPFVGGTTAIACIRTKRHFIGIELNQTYYEIAKRRIEKEQRQLTLF